MLSLSFFQGQAGSHCETLTARVLIRKTLQHLAPYAVSARLSWSKTKLVHCGGGAGLGEDSPHRLPTLPGLFTGPLAGMIPATQRNRTRPLSSSMDQVQRAWADTARNPGYLEKRFPSVQLPCALRGALLADLHRGRTSRGLGWRNVD